eukprot:g28659.t1
MECIEDVPAGDPQLSLQLAKDSHLEGVSGSVVGADDDTESIPSKVLYFLVPPTKIPLIPIEELWDFIAGIHGRHDRVRLALNRWEDFRLVFWSTQAACHTLSLAQDNRQWFRMCLDALRKRDGKYAVCFLQEPNAATGDKATWLLEWQGGVYISHLTHTSGGMAILLAPYFQPEILRVKEPVAGLLLHLTVWLVGRGGA